MVQQWAVFKGDNGRYWAGYTITTPFDGIEAASLPMATLAQQAELYALTQACPLAKDKTANIHTGSRYAFRVAHDFRELWRKCGFLTSMEIKFKNGPYIWELLNEIL